EESYGYLIKPFVRDKDAIQASLIIAEAAAYYKYFNKTLWDVLLDLYAELGWYKESQVSIVAQGAKGADLIKSIMQKLRNEPIRQLKEVGVVRYEDYQIQKAYELGKVYDLTLPQADVIKYFLADGSWIAIRPSGTEPKCKIYYCIAGNNEEQLLAKEKYYQQLMAEIVNI
ncbi:MAG: phospho-sugar mutase, partial [Lutispora sp.]|nr:phospho-sugar mutase [Lutispora sp.]